ncbi:probable starch synthase 4, chloroplastic/amyloplastic isoform X4 [Sorghum bicolor]|uniref:probable starch synthase 4, chloroplastic/amyloplastic isoform X4 n=1 Tax=Sorghum bicolor TaxID=4558 RepID=UPI000B42396D|nr:probable starch synthase 4, chloroplastic/amyloplastic isoform X4 [Sorghum bicolor]|eukprot:XP_021314540.1 probable starch synthase 4, chloroplastic/amyloplastic isoform X4 [Sorghum bicolor]
METPRLAVGAASRPPPPTPRFRRRRFPRPRGGVHCFPFARAARPVLLTRCSSSSSSREGNGDSRGKPRRESSSTVRLDVDADSDQGNCCFQVPSLADEGDVGELFRLAQRNILYINKQRLMAMEELKKLQDENNLLLEEIQVLETEMQGIPLEAAQSLSFSELLLRIDTMVISGMISMAEASDLREKVVTNRSIIQSAFSDIHHKPNTELLSELRLFLRKPIEKPLHIVHICSEMYPIASSGSLSTYVASLSCEIQKKGNLVEVILPKYTSINVDGIHGLRRAEAEYESYFGGVWHKNKIWTGTSSGVGLVLIEPSQLYYFSRDMLHGYPDDFERFSYFSRASLDYIVKSGKRPDIIHIHNWETAIVAPLFWDIFAHQGLGNTRILLTCQDLNSECLEEPNILEMCGLDPNKLHRPDRLQDTNKTHLVNILKGGIVYSNKVILMSSTDSKDSLIHGSRHGLQSTLTTHKEKISVASYGLDGELWDPSKDIFLPRRYSANDIEGKSICRQALRRRLRFNGDSSIIVGCICDDNSDIHSLKEAVHVALRRNSQVIIMEKLGSVVNSTLQALKGEILGDKIAFVEAYDESLAHLIYAGSDIILCSSFEDPSLQTAMKAIKYGSVPVQLNFPSDESRELEGHGCPNTAMSQYIISTYGDLSLSQTLDDFNNDPSHWDRQIKDGMARGSSWDMKCYNLHWDAYSSIRKL